MIDSNWQRGGNIAIALIVILLALPELQNVYTKNHYNLSFCSDSEIIEIERFDFFACEIGYLEGEMDLIFKLMSSDSVDNGNWYGSIDILILNHPNYNNFYNENNYGISNIEFLSLNISLVNEDLARNFQNINFQSDYYFLVFNWEYGRQDEVDYANSFVIDISYSINLKHNDY